MRYFITGGAGFIGSHVAEKLLENDPNAEITIYDNLSSGKKEFLAKHNNVELIEGDLLDLKKLKKSIAGHDFVFHLAANPDIRYGIEHTDTDLKQNTLVTYNILESMRINNIKKIAFSSTSAVYGEPKTIPTPENYGPLIPISLYGASKLACEALITSFCHTFDMQSWIFRFANIVGERSTHGVIFDFIHKLKKTPDNLEILGDGAQTKSYLDAEECAEAMLFVAANSNKKVNIFNLGSSDKINVKRIAELLVEEMNLNPKFNFTGTKRGWPGDVVLMTLDTKKINNLGWKAKLNSEEAIKKAIKAALKEFG